MSAKNLSKKIPDMYSFWGSDISEHLAEAASSSASASGAHEKVIVNCASEEYSRACQLHQLADSVRVVHIKFSGASIYQKKGRGAIVRYALDNDLTDPESLKSFTGQSGEWALDAEHSSENRLVFQWRHEEVKAQQVGNKRKCNHNDEDTKDDFCKQRDQCEKERHAIEGCLQSLKKKRCRMYSNERNAADTAISTLSNRAEKLKHDIVVCEKRIEAFDHHLQTTQS